MREIETPHGPARVHLHAAPSPVGALILGHGAGGSVDAPDLIEAKKAALGQNFTVALVEQPYRVAGRKSGPPPAKLDEAWNAAVADLCESELAGLPLVTGGRSAGARVACRTSSESGAIGILCLAFPVHPPGKPEKTRLDELDGVDVPVLVVQGESDPFGMPPDASGRTLIRVKGNHSLKASLDAIGPAVAGWLSELRN